MKYKCVVVVVTFNRKDMLLECLNALERQTRPLDSIVLIDNNSTDGTYEMLVENSFISTDLDLFAEGYKSTKNKIHYFKMKSNTGGAGGFYHGIEQAMSLNPNWVWVMDDDAEPDKNTLERLLGVENNEKYSFLAPKVIHKNIKGHTEFYHHKQKIDLIKIKEENLDNQNVEGCNYPLEANGFVGPLLNATAIKKVGLPDKSFFIWWDDTDFTFRLSRAHGEGLLVSSATLFHKDVVVTGAPKVDWKTFYGIRNRIRFFKKHIGLLGFGVLFLKVLRQYFIYLGKIEHRKLFEATWRELFFVR